MRKRDYIILTIGFAWLLVLAITWPVYPHARYNFNPSQVITNLEVTNLTEVTNITYVDGGKAGGGSGKGNMKYNDLATDIIEIELAILQLQQQADDTAIVDGTVIGSLEFFGDDDTASADAIAGSIVATSTGTWTDGAEDGRMELSVADDGVLNNDQLVLNTDGTIDVGTGQVGGLEQTYRFNMADPITLQTADSEWCIDARTSAAMTITRIDITLDADPTTELDWDLKFCDAFIGQASTTLIVAMDTTNGTSAITSFTDATVPANKCIMVVFGAAPDALTLQAQCTIYWDYD